MRAVIFFATWLCSGAISLTPIDGLLKSVPPPPAFVTPLLKAGPKPPNGTWSRVPMENEDRFVPPGTAALKELLQPAEHFDVVPVNLPFWDPKKQADMIAEMRIWEGENRTALSVFHRPRPAWTQWQYTLTENTFRPLRAIPPPAVTALYTWDPSDPLGEMRPKRDPILPNSPYSPLRGWEPLDAAIDHNANPFKFFGQLPVNMTRPNSVYRKRRAMDDYTQPLLAREGLAPRPVFRYNRLHYDEGYLREEKTVIPSDPPEPPFRLLPRVSTFEPGITSQVTEPRTLKAAQQSWPASPLWSDFQRDHPDSLKSPFREFRLRQRKHNEQKPLEQGSGDKHGATSSELGAEEIFDQHLGRPVVTTSQRRLLVKFTDEFHSLAPVAKPPALPSLDKAFQSLFEHFKIPSPLAPAAPATAAGVGGKLPQAAIGHDPQLSLGKFQQQLSAVQQQLQNMSHIQPLPQNAVSAPSTEAVVQRDEEVALLKSLAGVSQPTQNTSIGSTTVTPASNDPEHPTPSNRPDVNDDDAGSDATVLASPSPSNSFQTREQTSETAMILAKDQVDSLVADPEPQEISEENTQPAMASSANDVAGAVKLQQQRIEGLLALQSKLNSGSQLEGRDEALLDDVLHFESGSLPAASHATSPTGLPDPSSVKDGFTIALLKSLPIVPKLWDHPTKSPLMERVVEQKQHSHPMEPTNALFLDEHFVEKKHAPAQSAKHATHLNVQEKHLTLRRKETSDTVAESFRSAERNGWGTDVTAEELQSQLGPDFASAQTLHPNLSFLEHGKHADVDRKIDAVHELDQAATQPEAHLLTTPHAKTASSQAKLLETFGTMLLPPTPAPGFLLPLVQSVTTGLYPALPENPNKYNLPTQADQWNVYKQQQKYLFAPYQEQYIQQLQRLQSTQALQQAANMQQAHQFKTFSDRYGPDTAAPFMMYPPSQNPLRVNAAPPQFYQQFATNDPSNYRQPSLTSTNPSLTSPPVIIYVTPNTPSTTPVSPSPPMVIA